MFRGSPKAPEASQGHRGEQDPYDVSGDPGPGGSDDLSQAARAMDT